MSTLNSTWTAERPPLLNAARPASTRGETFGCHAMPKSLSTFLCLGHDTKLPRTSLQQPTTTSCRDSSLLPPPSSPTHRGCGSRPRPSDRQPLTKAPQNSHACTKKRYQSPSSAEPGSLLATLTLRYANHDWDPEIPQPPPPNIPAACEMSCRTEHPPQNEHLA
ncbi:hypothetical protein K456DRAFT_189430 [Colletotrichum gloeosporioides 23]|nr:hypothetical protein K456DRAFT_189430 [Colletotrichum gloeosporioides 23]